MGDTSVAVTAGAGTLLHSWSKTIGGNTVHDGFYLPGEFPYASYNVIASGISIATAADHVIQIMAGSSLNVRIRRIRIHQLANATGVNSRQFEIRRVTTAGTGGTAVTPAKLDPADTAAGCTAMTLPTAKGTESTVIHEAVILVRQALLTTSAQADEVWEWTQHPGTKPIIIAAGTANGIVLKNVTATAGASITVNVELVETNF